MPSTTSFRTLTGNGSTTQNSTGIPLDPRIEDFKVSISVDTDGSTTAATVQYTLDYPWGNYATSWDSDAVWVNHSDLAALTSDAVGNIAFPVWGVRLQVGNTGTDTVTMKVLQSGYVG